MKTDTDPIAEAFRIAFSAVVEPRIDPPPWDDLSARGPAVPAQGGRLQTFLRRPVVAAAAAAAAVLLAIGGTLFLVGSGSDSAPRADSIPDRVPTTLDLTTTPLEITTPETASTVPTTAVPGTAFTWIEGDLGAWVTTDEMTNAIKDAAQRYAGVELQGQAVLLPREPGDTGWTWALAGWRVLAHNGDHGGRYAGPPTEADPRLPSAVTYEAEDGFGYGGFVFRGPGSDELIAVHLIPPGWSAGNPLPRYHEDASFALASMMLREMGWTD